jgi:hypothetical protein
MAHGPIVRAKRKRGRHHELSSLLALTVFRAVAALPGPCAILVSGLGRWKEDGTFSLFHKDGSTLAAQKAGDQTWTAAEPSGEASPDCTVSIRAHPEAVEN